jgi:hypothetical protein
MPLELSEPAAALSATFELLAFITGMSSGPVIDTPEGCILKSSTRENVTVPDSD